ncbi:MAG: P-type conjugative transfer protein TrbG [Sphingomonadales bacterium]|nr:P-type conjugative transfer protein TrbG [Sphingomonadales bacterium]
MQRLITVPFVALLAACAHKTETTFIPATLEPEPRIDVVDVPVLPKPEVRPLVAKAPDTAPPEAQVAAALEQATVTPTRDGFVQAVQVYPFMDGALYTLYAAPGLVTDIMLEPGETLIAVSAGDTVRWIIGDTTSGSGDHARTHLLVKPTAADLVTNLIVTTDRRVYRLDLKSVAGPAMAAVSWDYPRDRLLVLKAARRQVAASVVDGGLDIASLSFAYTISGDRPAWRPVRIFDDGGKVYIEFPESLPTTAAPPLFILGPKGRAELVNYRLRGRHYVVDRLFEVAELRLGEKPQTIVRITRTGRGR